MRSPERASEPAGSSRPATLELAARHHAAATPSIPEEGRVTAVRESPPGAKRRRRSLYPGTVHPVPAEEPPVQPRARPAPRRPPATAAEEPVLPADDVPTLPTRTMPARHPASVPAVPSDSSDPGAAGIVSAPAQERLPPGRVRPPSLAPARRDPEAWRDSEAHDRNRADTPTVRVTIGRLEVRAAPPPERPARTVELRQPSLTLDRYLERRAARRA
jgi:hypothetical protein